MVLAPSHSGKTDVRASGVMDRTGIICVVGALGTFVGDSAQAQSERLSHPLHGRKSDAE
jgi:hypothetical protein